MTVQNSFSQGISPVQAPGKRPDSSAYDAVTRASVNNLPFGRAVVENAAGTTVDLPGTSSDKIAGVSMHINKMSVPGVETTYSQKEPVDVMKEGRIFMITETAVTDVKAAVFVRYADGGTPTTAKGVLRGSTGTSEAFAWTAAKYNSLAPAGGVVEVDIDCP